MVPNTVSAEEKAHGLFTAPAYDETYWDTYLLARPKYSSGFYEQILDYHKSHSLSETRKTAHDIGTGPGQVAAELSKHFESIIASDVAHTHIEIAATRLAKAGLTDKIVCVRASAEDIASKYPADSADLVAVAECIPLLDHVRAINAFARLLRPGGTLAIWFYGRPAFSEPEYASACQPILNEILDLTFEKIIKGGDTAHQTMWKHATDTMESWIDNLALSPETWQNVHRFKWNTRHSMPFYSPNACDFSVQSSSNIDETCETIIRREDPGFWTETWNIDEIRRFVEFLLPDFEEQRLRGAYAHIEPKYVELEHAIGGKDAKRAFTWPTVLILATKK